MGDLSRLSCSDQATHSGGSTAIAKLTGVIASQNTVVKMPTRQTPQIRDGLKIAQPLSGVIASQTIMKMPAR